MPRTRTAFADFSINPAAAQLTRKKPTLPKLDPNIDPLERKVRTIVADELGIDFGRAGLEEAFARLSDDVELDVIEICMTVERKFKLEEIDDADIERFVRVKDLVEYVRRRDR